MHSASVPLQRNIYIYICSRAAHLPASCQISLNLDRPRATQQSHVLLGGDTPGCCHSDESVLLLGIWPQDLNENKEPKLFLLSLEESPMSG